MTRSRTVGSRSGGSTFGSATVGGGIERKACIQDNVKKRDCVEHPLPITLGLFWIGLIAVAIFWIGMRVYGSRRSSLILMGISTAGFIAGAVVHPFSGGTLAPPPVAAVAPQGAPPADPQPAAAVAKPLRNLLLSANNETTVASLTANAHPGLGSVDEFGFTDSGGNFMQPRPLVVPSGSSLLLQGWAVIPTTKTPAAAVFVLVDGTRRIGGDYRMGIARPDVARALNNPNTEKSGFSLLVRTSGLAVGPHHLQLEATDGTGAFTLPTSYDFAVQ